METEYLPILIGCKDSNAKGSLELGRKTRYFLELPVEQSKTEGSGGSIMFLFLKLGPIWFSYFPTLYQLVIGIKVFRIHMKFMTFSLFV